MSDQFLRILSRTVRLPHSEQNDGGVQINAVHAGKKRKTFFDSSSTTDSPVKSQPTTDNTINTSPVTTPPITDKREMRKQMDIHITADNIKAVPAPLTDINQLHALLPSCANTSLLNLICTHLHRTYGALTPIQSQALPVFTQQTFDMLACAPTGSGKTLAYLIPLLICLNKPTQHKHQLRSVILCPTKELADQIHRVVVNLLRTDESTADTQFAIHVLTKSGKSDVPAYMDCIITTPARLITLVDTAELDCSHVEYLILDEADKLFDLNFLEQIDRILVLCKHKSIKRHLYSATMVSGVEMLAKSVLRNPVRITVGARNSAAQQIDQQLIFVGKEEGKLLALRQFMSAGLPVPMLIFVQSIDRAKQLHHELQYENIKLECIHSDKTVDQRQAIIRKFRLGEVWVLICTDILGRGIDFLNVTCVVNYDFPTSTTQYIHRIGRTGRAGRPGQAITFFTEIDKPLLRNIAEIVHHSGCDVPAWMLQSLPRIGKARGDRLHEFGVPRQSISKEVYAAQQENIKRLKNKSKRQKRATASSDAMGADEVTGNSDDEPVVPVKKLASKPHKPAKLSTTTKSQNSATSKTKSQQTAATVVKKPALADKPVATEHTQAKPAKMVKRAKPVKATFLQDQVTAKKHKLHGAPEPKQTRKQSPGMVARNERRWQAKLAQLKADGLIASTE